MRKLLLSLLLATTAATPAFAQRVDREDRAEAREERRAKQAQARKERAEPREVAGPERVQRAERVQRNIDARLPNVAVRDRQVRAERRAANVNERGRPTLDQRTQGRDEAIAARQQQRDGIRQQREDLRERVADRVNQRRVTPPSGARPDRPAPPPPTAATSNTKAPTWHTTWRHDDRYDWRRWRERNRSLFRLGFYFDPFGWGYRRYGVGWRLWPSYYNSSYWLNDPFTYRLPYAPWPYRWIRYYDDALLVNTMSGQVVDVMYEFFW